MALLEQEAIRFAESLDDYEHVTVTDIGGWGPIDYRVTVRDHRFDLDYEIASHSDYCGFMAALVDDRQCLSLMSSKEVA
jgi:hypothetical protein